MSHIYSERAKHIFISLSISIRLTERNDELNWIHIDTDSIFCLSPVGMKGGRQNIRAGGCLGEGGSFGKLAHEVMHSLGSYCKYKFDLKNYNSI